MVRPMLSSQITNLPMKSIMPDETTACWPRLAEHFRTTARSPENARTAVGYRDAEITA
jgi:hypothetical protein